MARQQFTFSIWKKENQHLIEEMFSNKLLADWSKKEILGYLTQVRNFYSNEQKRNYFTYHDLQYRIGDYLRQIEWEYRIAFTWENVFEFDLMAQKEESMMLIKVKPSPTLDDLEIAVDYANHVGKKTSSSRVFLATDILNFEDMFYGQSKKLLANGAKEFKLGIIFTNKNQSWIVPSEFVEFIN